MQLRIKRTNFRMTAEVSDYLDKKLTQFIHVLPKGTGKVAFDIELERILKGKHKGELFRAEFTADIHGTLYRAEANGETMLAAIDEAKAELKREMTRNKSLQRKQERKGGRTLKESIRGVGR
jgi:ribosomal subunit interface protein